MIDKQSFSTKPGILGPHRQRNRTLAAYKRNLIFQIFFQLKGLKIQSPDLWWGQGPGTASEDGAFEGEGTNSSWCILVRNHGRWQVAKGCSPEAIPMDRAGSCHLDQIGSQPSDITLPCWVSSHTPPPPQHLHSEEILPMFPVLRETGRGSRPKEVKALGFLGSLGKSFVLAFFL